MVNIDFRWNICRLWCCRHWWTRPSCGVRPRTAPSFPSVRRISVNLVRYSPWLGSHWLGLTELSWQIYADKGMRYSLKGSLQNLDLFQAIQLFLTPLCTVFSFAFTVPLVLKVDRFIMKYLTLKSHNIIMFYRELLRRSRREWKSWPKWWDYQTGCTGLAGSQSPFSSPS